jgi:YHS domain-containing protein
VAVVDPVCGRSVDKDAVDAAARISATGGRENDATMGTKYFHDGSWVYFCSLGCRHKFMSDPTAFAAENDT